MKTLFISFSLICSFFWVDYVFGNPTFDAVIYHLNLDSVFLGDSSYLLEYLFFCVVIPLILVTIIHLLVKKYKLTYKKLITVPFLVIGISCMVAKLKIPKFLYEYYGKDYLVDVYVEPTHLLQDSTNNLITIFVESLEDTYSKEEVIGKNLISPLTQIANENIYFKNLNEMPGGNWTIAGIVSSQCGLPLKNPLFIPTKKKENNHIGRFFPQFMKGAICLGDILKINNYKNIFINGPRLRFAGVGKFFQTHGYHEVIGKRQLKELPSENFHFHEWGVPDDELLDYSFRKYSDLIKKNKKINMTILTVDTHAPNGHDSEYCLKRNSKNISDRINCTSDLVAGFIKKIRDIDPKVVFLVVGDHLTKKNNLWNKLNSTKRTIFGTLILPENKREVIKDEVAQVDLFPITLSALGFKDICKLGVGRNLAVFNKNCTYKDFKSRKLYKVLSRHSTIIDKVWNSEKSPIEKLLSSN